MRAASIIKMESTLAHAWLSDLCVRANAPALGYPMRSLSTAGLVLSAFPTMHVEGPHPSARKDSLSSAKFQRPCYFHVRRAKAFPPPDIRDIYKATCRTGLLAWDRGCPQAPVAFPRRREPE